MTDLANSATPPPQDGTSAVPASDQNSPQPQPTRVREIGGRQGPEPTRYGDWELRGRCIDF